MTVQLATRVTPETKKILSNLHKKTHISIRQLTEKAIILLDEYYKELQKSHEKNEVDDTFISLLESSIKKHNKTYKQLAK